MKKTHLINVKHELLLINLIQIVEEFFCVRDFYIVTQQRKTPEAKQEAVNLCLNFDHTVEEQII